MLLKVMLIKKEHVFLWEETFAINFREGAYRTMSNDANSGRKRKTTELIAANCWPLRNNGSLATRPLGRGWELCRV